MTYDKILIINIESLIKDTHFPASPFLVRSKHIFREATFVSD